MPALSGTGIIRKKKKKYNSCQVEDFIGSHISKACVILRSRTTGFTWPHAGYTVRIRGTTQSEAAEFKEWACLQSTWYTIHAAIGFDVSRLCKNARRETMRALDPFNTAVPLSAQTTRNLTGLPPKRDCSVENG